MKKKSIILLIYLCAFLSTNKVFCEAVFTITPESSSQLINHLVCEYDFEVSESLIQQFLNGVMENPSSGCGEVIPNIVATTPTTETFDWPDVPNAKDYTVASLGLDDGTGITDVTLTSDYTFANLTNQTYIFYFLTNCLDGTYSAGTIVIIDNDLGTLPIEDYCECPSSTDIVRNPECPYTIESYSFPWNESFNSLKYSFLVSYIKDGVEQNRAFYLRRTFQGDNQNLGILDCSDDYYENNNIVEIGNDDYDVIFSSNGTHIYIVNSDVTAVDIVAYYCDPYGIGRSSEVAEYSSVEVFPNPFTDEIQIQLNNKKEVDVNISIFSVNGIRQDINLYDFNKSKGKLTIGTQNLSPGLYTILMDFGNYRINRRILKL